MLQCTIFPRILNQLGHGHNVFFYLVKVQFIIRNYHIKKPLCPISNDSMLNIAKNTKSAWTWTQVFLYDKGSIHYQKLSDQKPLCPISNASMYNIAKNIKSAWTWP
jgi:hypothetical protein